MSAKLFDYLFVEEFFTQTELDAIWADIDVFHERNLFDVDRTSAATLGPDKIDIASKTGFFLRDEVFNVEDTNIYKCCSKIFNGATADFAELGFPNQPVLFTNKSSTLLSLYVNQGKYGRHHDTAVTSVLFWFNREPKSFEGGDLIFPQINETIEFKNNSMLMFPSQAEHEVTEVVMDPELSHKSGRYCVSMFLTIS